MLDDTAIEELIKRAESGDAEAQCDLGDCYAGGIIDGQPNHNKAIEWLSKSAAQNNSNAQNYLAQYYFYGEAIEQCLSTAIDLWEKSAKQGNPWAQNDLGLRYLEGEGVDKDPMRGAELLKESAEQDCEEAQRNLVYLYRTGEAIDNNLNEAKKWEQRIEDKGYLYTIALFDILGVSGNIKENGTKKVLDLYRQTIELINKVAKDRSVGSAPIPAHGPIPAGLKVRWDQCVWVAGFVPNIGISYFSDTFVLWLRHEKNKEYGQSWTSSAYIGGKYPLLFSDVGVELRKFLHSEYFIFLKLCLEFFCRGIQKGIPLRGCVATGNAYMNKDESMFLGEALVEAARGESAQNSIGFAFGPSFSSYHPIFDEFFIPYKKHIKNGREQHLSPLMVDWAKYWRDKYSDISLETVISSMKNEDFKEYYDYAIEFWNFSEKYQDWPEQIRNRSEMKNMQDYYNELGNFLDRIV